MILSPLGAMMMPALKISTTQFGYAVSVYAFSAGISGIISAGFADRFDRKKLLLFFYVGFVVGTLFCGLADTYIFLLLARMITGLFGGVIGSIVGAITTDLFHLQMRGRVMGFIQTAFAGSQVLGLPLGLYISNEWGWHAPFLMIVTVSTVIGVVIFLRLKPIDAHLKLKPDQSAGHHFLATALNPRYVYAFFATALLSIGGYMLMPFGSAFMIHNVGIAQTQLPVIYLVTGLASILIGPLVGRISDKVGKYQTFIFGSAVSIVMVLIYTHLGVSSLTKVILVNVCLFVGIFSRMIPAQALMSAIPDQLSRGSFMAINASIQQMSGGLASMVAGLVVFQGPDEVLHQFDVLGYIMVFTTLFSLAMMYGIHTRVREPDPQPAF